MICLTGMDPFQGVVFQCLRVTGGNGTVEKGQLKLSLEALAIDKRFTSLFTDEEANEALMRLLEAGYKF